jgi:hypothetical protein
MVTFKIVQRILFHAELWLPWKKNLLLKNPRGARAKIFGVEHLLVSVYQILFKLKAQCKN